MDYEVVGNIIELVLAYLRNLKIKKENASVHSKWRKLIRITGEDSDVG